MVHLRFIALIAGAAFILAFLTGLISGVGFGMVFFRSFFTALVFGGLAFAARIVFDKFLPGLTENPEKASQSAVSESFGADEDLINSNSDDIQNRVDITLEEESPQYSEPQDMNTFVEEVEAEGESGDFSFGRQNGSSDEDAALSEYENAADSEQDTDTGNAGDLSAESSDSSDNTEFESGNRESGGDVDDLGDELPNLDQFSSTFNSVGNDFLDSNDSMSPAAPSGSADESVDIMGDEHSTADLAKAVQTLLSKDEKG